MMKNISAASFALCVITNPTLAQEVATNNNSSFPYAVDVQYIERSLRDVFGITSNTHPEHTGVGVFANQLDENGHKFAVLGWDNSGKITSGVISHADVFSSKGTIQVTTSHYNQIPVNSQSPEHIELSHGTSINPFGMVEYQGAFGNTDIFNFSGREFHRKTVEAITLCLTPNVS